MSTKPEPIFLKTTLSSTIIEYEIWNPTEMFPESASVGNYRDECFAMVSVTSPKPMALFRPSPQEILLDTVLWGYKHIRLRPALWQDKRLFMKRIFRIAQMRMRTWVRDAHVNTQIKLSVVLTVIGSQKIWFGYYGDICILFYNRGILMHNIISVSDPKKGQYIDGIQRSAIPHFYTRPIQNDDAICILDPSLVPDVTTRSLSGLLMNRGQTFVDQKDAIRSILLERSSKDKIVAGGYLVRKTISIPNQYYY